MEHFFNLLFFGDALHLRVLPFFRKGKPTAVQSEVEQDDAGGC